MQDRKSGPLKGLRVVEFAGIGPGPFAGMLLADMGADVVSVLQHTREVDPETTISFRGRSLLKLDLKRPEDLAAAKAMIAQADVLIEGFRPGVMERLGLGPAELHETNPKLIYGRMTGWGQHGPMAPFSGHDLNYIALTGALAAIGPTERPVPPLNLVGDYGGGSLYLVMGILAARLHVLAGGMGQVIDCAICDGAASLMAPIYEMRAQGHWSEGRESNLLDGGAPNYAVYRCADASFVAVAPLEPQFRKLLLARLGLADDPDFASPLPSHWRRQHARLSALFETQPRPYWCALLEESDACFAPILTFDEAKDHPHMAAREVFIQRGGIVQPAPAPRFEATPSNVRAPVETDARGILLQWKTA